MNRLERIEARFKGIDTDTLKHLLRSNGITPATRASSGGTIEDEYLQAVDQEIERREKALDDDEIKNLIKLFQAFIQLPDSGNLQLRMHSDTGGTLYLLGKTISNEKLILNWSNLENGATEVAGYLNEVLEDE